MTMTKILDNNRELVLENKNKSYGQICDILSFKGLVVSEQAIANWFKKNNIDRKTTSKKENIFAKPKIKQISTFGYAYGRNQTHRRTARVSKA